MKAWMIQQWTLWIVRMQVVGWKLRILYYRIVWNRIVAPLALKLSRQVEEGLLNGSLSAVEMHPILVIPEPIFLHIEDRDFYHER